MSSSNHEDWGGGDYTSSFGKAASFYPPKDEKIERHPDKRPSSSAIEYSDDPKKDLTAALMVTGLGVIVLRASSGHPDGKLRFEGLSTFTKDEIQFD